MYPTFAQQRQRHHPATLPRRCSQGEIVRQVGKLQVDGDPPLQRVGIGEAHLIDAAMYPRIGMQQQDQAGACEAIQMLLQPLVRPDAATHA